MTADIVWAEVGTCMTPGCTAEGGRGLYCNFCQPCADNLARIREEFQREQEARTPLSVGNGKRKNAGKPLCCIRGCGNVRIPPEVHCAECSLAIELEEAA